MAEDNKTVETLNATEEATTNATNAFSFFGSMAVTVRDHLGSLNDKLGSLKGNFEQNQRTLDNLTTAAGLATTAFLGTRKSFEGLSGIDTSGLNTFSDQINDIKTAIMQMPDLAKTLKLPPNVLAGGPEKVLAYLDNLAASASNAQKLQNAYIQLGARTGALGDIQKAAGTNFENINSLLQKQQKLVTDTAAATGTSQGTVESYYAMLGQVPKALNATVTGADGAESSVSMLTATMQVAAGSGRKYSDIIDDLKIAFKDYNITGDEALKFTARIGEISNRYGIELDDVQSALRSTANEFKYFGNEAEGAAALMNQYIGAIQKTGVSGTVAVDIVRSMTSQIKDLTIAQKGFLSAQTGGPGGLMGAFQIEKELREGKIDKVFDRVRQSMTKQFGKIVSLEEASQSQAAAAQLTKQIMLLRQGPLGQFAKTDQEAIRVLEGFKATERGEKAEPLSSTITEDVQKVGVDINKKSYTELTRIRALIEQARGNANISNKDFFENALSAGTTQENQEVDPNYQLRENLGKYIDDSSRASAEIAKDANLSTLGDKEGNRTTLLNTSGEAVAENINNTTQFVKDLPDAVRAPISTVKSLFNENTVNKNFEEENKKQVMANLDKAKSASNSEVTEAIDTSTLGGVVNRSISVNQDQKAATKTGNETSNINVTAPESNYKFTVQVEGFCLDCGDKIKGKNQIISANPTERLKK